MVDNKAAEAVELDKELTNMTKPAFGRLEMKTDDEFVMDVMFFDCFEEDFDAAADDDAKKYKIFLIMNFIRLITIYKLPLFVDADVDVDVEKSVALNSF